MKPPPKPPETEDKGGTLTRQGALRAGYMWVSLKGSSTSAIMIPRYEEMPEIIMDLVGKFYKLDESASRDTSEHPTYVEVFGHKCTTPT